MARRAAHRVRAALGHHFSRVDRPLWLPVIAVGGGLGAVSLAVAAAASGRPVGVETMLSIGFGMLLGAGVSAVCLKSAGRLPRWGVQSIGMVTGWLFVLAGIVLTAADPWSLGTLALSVPGLLFGLAVAMPLMRFLPAGRSDS